MTEERIEHIQPVDPHCINCGAKCCHHVDFRVRNLESMTHLLETHPYKIYTCNDISSFIELNIKYEEAKRSYPEISDLDNFLKTTNNFGFHILEMRVPGGEEVTYLGFFAGSCIEVLEDGNCGVYKERDEFCRAGATCGTPGCLGLQDKQSHPNVISTQPLIST